MLDAIGLIVLVIVAGEDSAGGIGIPFEKGAQWVYAGTATSPRSDGGVETIHLTARLVEVVRRGSVVAARIDGCPFAVAGPDGTADECVYVLVGADRLYVVEPPRGADVIGRLRDAADELVGLLVEGELVIDTPLTAGKRIGETAQLTRACPEDPEESCPFAWTVTATSADEYQLRWQGQTGHKTLRFRSGVGVTGFGFLHGPSGAAAELKLIDYRAGQR